MRPAFNIEYWKGVSNHVDVSAGYTGAFYQYPFQDKEPEGTAFEGLFSQIDLSLNARLLDASKGINSERLTATGYGIENPKADNATVAGRAQNRRVEFKTGE